MDQTDQLQLEIQLRQARKADIEKRVLDHKNRVDQVKSGIESRSAQGQGPGNIPLDFLAIGDSWFEYPINDDGLPAVNQAIPPHLEKMGPPPLILNLPRHGQASTAVLSWENHLKPRRANTMRQARTSKLTARVDNTNGRATHIPAMYSTKRVNTWAT